jgi:NADH-quinone oxidoreductase subunit J
MEMLTSSTILFYMIATAIVVFSLSVLFNPNPLFSALNLALCMISLAGLYYGLGAKFIAGVQLIVYAGAVMVLFVMVLMLFDIRREREAFSRGPIATFFKIFSALAFLGVVAVSVGFSVDMVLSDPRVKEATQAFSTKDLAKILYTDYVFAFEVLGVALLVVAVGAVVLSRIKGGTHARH